jgi:hypothetical protein
MTHEYNINSQLAPMPLDVRVRLHSTLVFLPHKWIDEREPLSNRTLDLF